MATITAARPRKIRIGDLLVQHKVISQSQLDTALEDQKSTGRKLGRVLIDNGYLSEAQLMDFLSRQLKIPYVDLKYYNFNPQAVRLIPETHARRFRAVALEESLEGVLVGMADPTDIFAYDEISRVVRRPVRLAVVKESDLLKALDVVYRRTEEISGLAAELEEELAGNEVDLGQLAAAEGITDAPVVRLLQSVFEDAVQVNASDIHIEPDERQVRIRFRIDGVLRVQTTSDPRIASALASRLKLMAGLNIAERRIPQDGRFNVRVRDHTVDVRMSVMPVQYGESVVMRLLDQSAGMLSLTQLGMPDAILDRFRGLVHKPHGMVLVTGPTGSGKTTTLYAALAEINRPERKIITVEDPVEYRLPGISQVQVNPQIDLSFSRVLRSILRHDPDVVLVGEMRDRETVEIGLRAALTGHLVLSTLHTNDAVSTAIRLLDMGAKPFLVADALRAVVAQRLVRRICESCSEPAELEPGQRVYAEAVLSPGAAEAGFRRGRGCAFCAGTGYRGRIGVYELIETDEAMVKALHHGDAAAFEQAARSQPGYRSLQQTAIELAARGATTLEEVMRVVLGAED
jgi:MSHA biogenesis protein MshE